MMGFIWNYNVWGPKVPTSKLCLQSKYVYDKCDGLDGLVDGLIQNPLACQFDPMTELPACNGDVDSSDCWTIAQREAIKAIYDGPRTSDGQPITLGPYGFTLPGMPLGSEVCSTPGDPSSSMWMSYIGGGAGVYGDVVRYMVLRDLTFDPALFNFDTDPARVMARPEAGWMNAFNPDLSGMKNLGHKLLQWEAWGVYSPAYLYEYYRAVMDQMGGQANTDDFFRAYLVVGSGHCGGGIGASTIDWFSTLQNWVENDVVPDVLVGSRGTIPYGPAMTRPICPYPRVARYLGTGSIDDAANFTCAEIIPAANVRIIPERVSLGHTRKFAAVIRLPEGYKTGDLEDSTVVCEGALATKAYTLGQTRGIAWFNMEDLINPITPGDEVTFSVSVIANYNGQTIAFEGSDTVKVTE
jgi:feruloyl esterase